ncbi:hypothetical protein CA51_21990 [Rosistilla oblonga]|uniref:hypothetical protein n=1 Tax=Rosistilla oblonga TaxID=2527990 RepID=UPI00118C6BA1|nr:hypothetical protein [Rosistilla oblonga]QDV12317.1 hypothetical protein CA51_21990 [Rosistilla oblonga]
MSWFQQLTGIDESSPQQVRAQLSVDGEDLVCPDGTRIACGRLETPTLVELRARAAATDSPRGRLSLREIVADVRRLHADPGNANSLFQVASQFNLLEMASPTVTPERGVGIYEHDHTQGPACAVACGAGTIYRNYFAAVGDCVGQSRDHQIDCSADLGRLLGNREQQLWRMQNGYLFPTDSGLRQISRTLESAAAGELDSYRDALRIGLQWNTAVTLAGSSHRVSQAYCSALPVAYGSQPAADWTAFAKLVLEAAYEATLAAAVVNLAETGSNKLYLTLLGGGVFGNRNEWIIAAIERAVASYRETPLDIAIVSYGASHPAVAALVQQFSKS